MMYTFENHWLCYTLMLGTYTGQEDECLKPADILDKDLLKVLVGTKRTLLLLIACEVISQVQM